MRLLTAIKGVASIFVIFLSFTAPLFTDDSTYLSVDIETSYNISSSGFQILWQPQIYNQTADIVDIQDDCSGMGFGAGVTIRLSSRFAVYLNYRTYSAENVSGNVSASVPGLLPGQSPRSLYWETAREFSQNSFTGGFRFYPSFRHSSPLYIGIGGGFASLSYTPLDGFDWVEDFLGGPIQLDTFWFAQRESTSLCLQFTAGYESFLWNKIVVSLEIGYLMPMAMYDEQYYLYDWQPSLLSLTLKLGLNLLTLFKLLGLMYE